SHDDWNVSIDVCPDIAVTFHPQIVSAITPAHERTNASDVPPGTLSVVIDPDHDIGQHSLLS
ncbi:MAG: hypothetical protein KBG75_10490, partial [Pseudomonadales bacterium]|nr:hypothetical protein [Pseudomonadales bacterium]